MRNEVAHLIHLVLEEINAHLLWKKCIEIRVMYQRKNQHAVSSERQNDTS